LESSASRRCRSASASAARAAARARISGDANLRRSTTQGSALQLCMECVCLQVPAAWGSSRGLCPERTYCVCEPQGGIFCIQSTERVSQARCRVDLHPFKEIANAPVFVTLRHMGCTTSAGSPPQRLCPYTSPS